METRKLLLTSVVSDPNKIIFTDYSVDIRLTDDNIYDFRNEKLLTETVDYEMKKSEFESLVQKSNDPNIKYRLIVEMCRFDYYVLDKAFFNRTIKEMKDNFPSFLLSRCFDLICENNDFNIYKLFHDNGYIPLKGLITSCTLQWKAPIEILKLYFESYDLPKESVESFKKTCDELISKACEMEYQIRCHRCHKRKTSESK